MNRGRRRWIQGAHQLLYINVQWFRDGLAFKAHRLYVSLISRLESKAEKERERERETERERKK